MIFPGAFANRTRCFLVLFFCRTGRDDIFEHGFCPEGPRRRKKQKRNYELTWKIKTMTKSTKYSTKFQGYVVLGSGIRVFTRVLLNPGVWPGSTAPAHLLFSGPTPRFVRGVVTITSTIRCSHFTCPRLPLSQADVTVRLEAGDGVEEATLNVVNSILAYIDSNPPKWRRLSNQPLFWDSRGIKTNVTTQRMTVTASASAFDWPTTISPLGLGGGTSEGQKWPVHPRPLLLIG